MHITGSSGISSAVRQGGEFGDTAVCHPLLVADNLGTVWGTMECSVKERALRNLRSLNSRALLASPAGGEGLF